MKILARDRLKEVLSFDNSNGLRLFVFKPTIFRLFPKSGHTHNMTLSQKIRFFLSLLRGYSVYVLTDEAEDVIGTVAYSVGGALVTLFPTKKI